MKEAVRRMVKRIAVEKRQSGSRGEKKRQDILSEDPLSLSLSLFLLFESMVSLCWLIQVTVGPSQSGTRFPGVLTVEWTKLEPSTVHQWNHLAQGQKPCDTGHLITKSSVPFLR